MKNLILISSLLLSTKIFASADVVDMSLVDPTINPCEDFFEYACGNWLRQNPVPSDKGSLYRFTEIDENTLVILKNILENYVAGRSTPAQNESKKLGDAYSACLDQKSNDVNAGKDLSKLLKSIQQFKDKKDLMAQLGQLHRQGINPFFAVYSMQNPGDATHVIGVVDQAGLGLPEKGFYFEKENSEIRDAYKKHMAASLKLAGLKDADVSRIYKMEEAVAKISLSNIEQQDPVKTFNPIGKKALQMLTPDMNWAQYFTTIHFDSADSLDVVSPAFFKKLSLLIKTFSLKEIRDYMSWMAIRSTSSFAGTALEAEHFNFYGKILDGTKEPRPRWKTCIASVDNSMGEALGEAFIKEAFGKDAKTLADEMVLGVKTSLKELITQLDWMDDSTKSGALKKIQTLNQKIGFPNQFKTYANLPIARDSWFANNMSSNIFSFDEMISKVNKKVDRDAWGMTPPTNNAYYDPTMNEIVFPAGILQAPLFNVSSGLAANYGATGATIGHEMTHGFDDSGRQYDELGNLKDWWSEKSTKVYKEKSQCLIKQYDSFTIKDGTHLNGELTLDENIADLGGLKIAYLAYLKNHARFSNDELKIFFIAYAQSWCGQSTDESLQTQVKTDVHSPARFRVNGVVLNLPEFAESFQCAEGEPMAPVNRCSVW